MICILCRQAEIVSGHTSVSLVRGEFRVSITDVPAWICPACGEAYLEQGVVTAVVQGAGESLEAGMRDSLCAYEPIIP